MTEPIRKAIAEIDQVTSESEIPLEVVDSLLEASPDNEILATILDRLGNDKYNDFVQFCYAVVAGMNLSDELIDPVLKLFSENTDRHSLLECECQCLLSALTCVYPEQVGPKVLPITRRMKRPNKEIVRYFLYEAFFYLPLEEYGKELIELYEWEPIKLLKNRLRVIITDRSFMRQVPEALQEAFNQRIELSKEEFLEGAIDYIPFFELRQVLDWKDYYKPGKSESEDDLKNHEEEELLEQAEVLEAERQKQNEKKERYDAKRLWNSQKVNRNAPCPCESGKKFKKCCGK